MAFSCDERQKIDVLCSELRLYRYSHSVVLRSEFVPCHRLQRYTPIEWSTSGRTSAAAVLLTRVLIYDNLLDQTVYWYATEDY